MNFEVVPSAQAVSEISTLATVNVPTQPNGEYGPFSVQVNGVDITLTEANFVITSIDTTDPDFLNKTYKIEWTSPAGTQHHSGYYLSYDGFNENTLPYGKGGPLWSWYSGADGDWRSYWNGTRVNVPTSDHRYNEVFIQFTYYLHTICIRFAYDLHMIFIQFTYDLHMLYI